MHPVSPELLAQASSWSFQPLALLEARDTQIRWHPLIWTDPYVQDLKVSHYHNGSILMRARVTTTGYVATATHYTNDAAELLLYHTIATDAAPNSDCAITWSPPNTWQIYYSTPSNAVVRRTSADDGLTWSAPTTITTATRPPCLAARGGFLIVQDTDVRAFYYTAGTWHGPTNYGYTITSPAGVAAIYDAPSHTLTILSAHNNRLHHNAAHCTLPTITPGPTTVIAPDSDSPAATTPAIAWPAIENVPYRTRYVATWLDTYTSPLATYQAPTASVAAIGSPHFGQRVPLAPPGTCPGRWPLAYDPLGSRIYCGNDAMVLLADHIYDPAIRSHDVIGPTPTLSYHLEQHHHQPGRLTIDVLDPDGTYRDPETVMGALLPLSTVLLHRGYTTDNGDETVSTAEFYITSATLSEAQRAGHLHIDATDAWGLLDLYHPPEPQEWHNRTIRWLLAHLCAMVGLDTDDTATHTNDTLAVLRIWPSASILPTIQALLTMADADARPAPDRTLSITNYPRPLATPPSANLFREAKAAAFGTGLPIPNHYRIASDTYGVYTERDNLDAARTLGMRISRLYHDNTINSATIANNVASHLTKGATTHTRQDTLVIPLRPDLEVNDQIATYGIYPSPQSPKTRLILSLVEESRPYDNIHQTTLELGKIP
jgi:hypothetical protein